MTTLNQANRQWATRPEIHQHTREPMCGCARVPQPPYPWCRGNPTREDCVKRGYCRRDPLCGD